jgi:hypothetical protein
VAVRSEVIVGNVVQVNGTSSVVVQPLRAGAGDDANENQPKPEPVVLTVNERTVVVWNGEAATLAELRKGLRVTGTFQKAGADRQALRIEVLTPRRDRGKPEGPEKPAERKSKD